MISYQAKYSSRIACLFSVFCLIWLTAQVKKMTRRMYKSIYCVQLHEKLYLRHAQRDLKLPELFT